MTSPDTDDPEIETAKRRNHEWLGRQLLANTGIKMQEPSEADALRARIIDALYWLDKSINEWPCFPPIANEAKKKVREARKILQEALK